MVNLVCEVDSAGDAYHCHLSEILGILLHVMDFGILLLLEGCFLRDISLRQCDL